MASSRRYQPAPARTAADPGAGVGAALAVVVEGRLVMVSGGNREAARRPLRVMGWSGFRRSGQARRRACTAGTQIAHSVASGASSQ